VSFLGHVISEGGVAFDPSKVSDVLNWRHLENAKDASNFVVLAGNYCRFIENFSIISKPMTELLKKGVPFKWSDACENAFQTLKTKLTSPPIHTQLDVNKGFNIYCNASRIDLDVFLCKKDMSFPMPLSN
jgi:hypothetical protein